ncbi:MAG: glycerophosphodiester phosphodiesterase [Burkholderiales bacterium]|nr:glycerophosphodiester phosphodiesterase [Burkholderiales bacterium]
MTRAARAAGLAATLALTGCALFTPPFDIQGHRGARGLAPENTLAGFKRALDAGVSTLELDIGVTRDGVVVIHHDESLNPDTTRDARGAWLTAPTPRLFDLTWLELQAYDVGRLRPGSNYAARYPAQVGRDGEPIPSLAQLFAWVQAAGHDRVRFNIETKLTPARPGDTAGAAAMTAALLAVIHAHGMQRRVTIQSFDWRTLALVQADAPGIPTAYLSAERPGFNTIDRDGLWTAGRKRADFASVPAMVHAAGGAIWSPHFEDLTPELLRAAHALGLKVIPWTVNDPADMRRLIAWGVDGIISDRPDLLRTALEQAGH